MTRALALLIVLSGCATAEHGELRAALAPLCFFNCVISVTYAPGVERLESGTRVNDHDDILR